MEFLEFKKEDALFCFKVRTAAFIEKFFDELSPAVVSAAVASYLPADYIRMSREMKIFMISDNHKKIGFVCIKKIDNNTAEIPLIYLDLLYLGKGYGSKTMKFVEQWVRENWEKVKNIFLDTVIPGYNGEFYKKMGYQLQGNSTCVFNNLEVSAIRFKKNLF